MSQTMYVLDTSYLLELYAVPGSSTEEAIREIRSRYDAALGRGDPLFVPLGCIYELGNHIADVSDGTRRRQLTLAVEEDVRSSLDPDTVVWKITPVPAVEALPGLFEDFRKRFIPLSIGLTDTHVIQEAEKLSGDRETFGYKVHIWTKDKQMKSYEPDKEDSPFLG